MKNMGPSHEAADYAVACPAYPVRTPMVACDHKPYVNKSYTALKVQVSTILHTSPKYWKSDLFSTDPLQSICTHGMNIRIPTVLR